MSKEPEHMDPMENHYRKSFKEFREEPSEDLLARIKSKLPAGAIQHAPRKKGRFIWLFVLAIVFSLVFSIIYRNRLQDTKRQPTHTNESPETPIIQPDQEYNKIKSEENLPIKRIESKKSISPPEQEEVKAKTKEALQMTDSIKVNSIKEAKEEKKTDNKSEEHLEDDDDDFYQKQTKQYKDSVRHLFRK